jgi:hypothetical protein
LEEEEDVRIFHINFVMEKAGDGMKEFSHPGPAAEEESLAQTNCGSLVKFDKSVCMMDNNQYSKDGMQSA